MLVRTWGIGGERWPVTCCGMEAEPQSLDTTKRGDNSWVTVGAATTCRTRGVGPRESSRGRCAARATESPPGEDCGVVMVPPISRMISCGWTTLRASPPETADIVSPWLRPAVCGVPAAWARPRGSGWSSTTGGSRCGSSSMDGDGRGVGSLSLQLEALLTCAATASSSCTELTCLEATVFLGVVAEDREATLADPPAKPVERGLMTAEPLGVRGERLPSRRMPLKFCSASRCSCLPDFVGSSAKMESLPAMTFDTGSGQAETDDPRRRRLTDESEPPPASLIEPRGDAASSTCASAIDRMSCRDPFSESDGGSVTEPTVEQRLPCRGGPAGDADDRRGVERPNRGDGRRSVRMSALERRRLTTALSWSRSCMKTQPPDS
mmetsp:Transcript_17975/g.54067  ORF Transcript_17975/g.54067 Transcript_17975/m.54067 type:complete len:380 (+) Transcript_17975:501-1640(+)